MRIVFISDMDTIGSGYFMLSSNLCSGLAKLGHEIKVLGLHYQGDEHEFPFSILPCENLQDAMAMFHNFAMALWKPDVVIVALDIPIQRMFVKQFQNYPVPYFGVMPLESGPLCMSWAMVLMQMRKVFMISQHATDEVRKRGVDAEHLQIGVDVESWRLPSAEERKALRDVMGVDDETFVVLTVADNQERKNLPRALEIVAEFGNSIEGKFRYVMVTREHCPVGMEIRDYASDLGINNNLDIYERGIDFRQLWSLYAASDAFLLTSKAEGLGMPFLEAMAVGLPVVGTRSGALIEHVERGGGWLIEPETIFIDCFGNGKRAFADVADGVRCLREIYNGINIERAVTAARRYIEARQWEIPVLMLDEAIKEVTDVQENPQAKSEE